MRLTLHRARVSGPIDCDGDCCCALPHGDSLLLRVVYFFRQMLQSKKSIESSSTLINPSFYVFVFLSRSLFFQVIFFSVKKLFQQTIT